MSDDLIVNAFDPQAQSESPRKPYLDNYSEITDEVDEPTLFELAAINVRKVFKRFKDAEPKEVTEMGFAFAMLDEDKKVINDAETGKPLSVEHVINRPKQSSYEFFKNTGVYKFFKELKLEITEDLYQKPMHLGNAIGLRVRLMVNIITGVSQKTGKAWKVAKVKSVQAPKDKADIDSNNSRFKAIFPDA